MTFHEILEGIHQELDFAESKHPRWPADLVHQAAILGEEAGEVIQAALQCTYEGADMTDLKNETLQCAAMCVRLLKNLPRSKS
jgi:NTP pyrophosphatase (non-canonical NTP hydrolase)